MAGGMPSRHGVDWGRVAPAPAVRTDRIAPTPVPQPAPRTPVAQVAAAGTFPVRVLDAFFQLLPDPSLQQFSQVVEGRWPVSVVAGTQIQLTNFLVPERYVYVITDVIYYATAPSPELEGLPVQIQPYQLSGLVRFALTVNGITPLRQDQSVHDPYAAVTAAAVARSGWPFVDHPFGAQRTSGFALYARSQAIVSAVASVDTPPRFSLTKVGAHMHGFGIPESVFELLFKGDHGGLGKGQR